MCNLWSLAVILFLILLPCSPPLLELLWVVNQLTLLTLLPLFPTCRLWPHCSPLRRGKGLLYHLLCHRHPLHPPLPHGRGAKDHGLQHTPAHHLRAHSLGPLQAPSSHRPRHPAGHGGCGLLLPNPGGHFLGSGGGLEFSGVLLLLLHLPEHHRLGRLCARGGLQSEIPWTV